MKPIIFSTTMVQAILAGNKTQTRRVIKIKDGLNLIEIEKDPIVVDDRRASGERVKPGLHAIFEDWESKLYAEKARYQPGDVLLVRETWQKLSPWLPNGTLSENGKYFYAADGEPDVSMTDDEGFYKENFSWRPSIHMPREAARIFLRVTGVRCERVQDISEEDARAEGCEKDSYFCEPTYKTGFCKLWESINKKRGYGWDANPWVWRYTFGRISREEA